MQIGGLQPYSPDDVNIGMLGGGSRECHSGLSGVQLGHGSLAGGSPPAVAEAAGERGVPIGKRIMDVWFIDDNCLATPPAIFDEALRALDKALEARGVTRGVGSDVKSTARIICKEDEVEA